MIQLLFFVCSLILMFYMGYNIGRLDGKSELIKDMEKEMKKGKAELMRDMGLDYLYEDEELGEK